MPNNIVFNNVANELKTQIYGSNGGVATPISVDGNGNLIIGSIETITYVASVDTVNEVANVSSVDTVDYVASVGTVTNVSSVDTVDYVASVSTVTNVNSVDTVDQVANVSSVDTVDYVASVDTVNEVANVSSVDTVDYLASVGTIAHITDTVDVKIVSNDFAENVATVALAASGVATVLTTLTSEKNMYSFYVRNTSSTATIDAQVQIAPIDSDAYYVDDAASISGITTNGISVLVPQKYLKYTRLILTNNNGTATASAVAYFQGHN
ncbi:hypothetical protein HNQ80_001812 [Anaerosolibacter carboniphilus]|uniref:DUF6385 domain-containing protein n=1 Tax=Anaerosolibacter carboniphilus TaxID=1417629 RepID=A0A841KQM0_9FIRM|nr:DUF6385 domain-containing protein [Anaerosolibacter carboniphilus]MBB6215723.1 hypothetical protein [Anaerosolibacter carboniphilus]